MTRPDLDSLARAWGVSLDGIPLQTKEGKLAYGVKDGQPVRLKVLGTSFDAAGSRETLERFEGQGAVAVLASCPSAILMERLTPGTTLNKQMQTDQSLDDVRIFCATALALHGTDAALDGIPSTQQADRSDWCGQSDTDQKTA